MRSKAPTTELRITGQYRVAPTGKVCELECLGAQLRLHVWEIENQAEPAWCVEARSGNGEAAVVVTRSAGTRSEALRDVGSSWAAERKMPRFDWDKVAELLASVRLV